MKRLTFMVNQGENGCFMIHGLDWANYHEGGDWGEIIDLIKSDVKKVFSDDSMPTFLDFKFSDGTVVSLGA